MSSCTLGERTTALLHLSQVNAKYRKSHCNLSVHSSSVNSSSYHLDIMQKNPLFLIYYIAMICFTICKKRFCFLKVYGEMNQHKVVLICEMKGKWVGIGCHFFFFCVVQLILEMCAFVLRNPWVRILLIL